MALEIASKTRAAPVSGARARPIELAAARAWSSLWPKVVAVALALLGWQVVVWSGTWPDYLLPGPVPVFARLAEDLRQPEFWGAFAITLQRAALGYGIALVIGTGAGLLVARVAPLRRAVGSAILGVQSMPSIAWFPLAVLLFKLSEQAILFVVVLGAAPAIAGGLLSGVDHVQPLLVRVGRVMGARGLALYRYVILPASMPAFIGGLKQGWAFAWRSLMAGELLVIVGHKSSLGVQLDFARQFSDSEQMLALMIVIFVIGVTIDRAFGTLDARIRSRWGLGGAAD